ncbi:uncharacterized protein V1518DRAFT_415698 [Limtongia smithiae]|uniref:uncharacterized protein n=1 Tax=Limtongia smithiae TaxID=1125753 RepID=UPI0034CF7640
MADLLAAFTSVSDGQFMRSCQRCRAKGILNRRRRRDELAADAPGGIAATDVHEDADDDDDAHAATVDFQARCASWEDFAAALAAFMAAHDPHPDFDQLVPAVRFRITLLASAVLPRNAACPARTVDAVVRDTPESQKLAALMLRDALFDATGYFFQLRKGGRPHPDGGKYNFSCSRAEERKGAYDRTKRMRDVGGVRQRRTKARDFFRCEGRVMMCFSRTNSWITIVYAHKRHVATPKIHEKKDKPDGIGSPQSTTHASSSLPAPALNLLPVPGPSAPLHHLHHHLLSSPLDPQTQIDPALMEAEVIAAAAAAVQQHHQQQQGGPHHGQYDGGEYSLQ